MSRGLLVLAGAALTFVLGLWWARRATKSDTLSLQGGRSAADWQERFTQLILQLKELEQLKARITPQSYEEERQRLEQEAAYALEQSRQKPAQLNAQQSSTAVGFLRRHPQLQGALWGGGFVAVVAILWALLPHAEDPAATPQNQPGPMASQGAALQGEAQQLLSQLKSDPSNVPVMVRLSHLLLQGQLLEEAQILTERALQFDPKNKEALVHAAVIKSANDMDAALGDLDKIVATDPAFPEAWLFRGMIAMRSGKTELMRDSFTQFVKTAPAGPQRERIRAMLEQK